MTPLRVSAKNYGPYSAVEWEIPQGLSALVGHNTIGEGADSNGAGKTKLLELIPICLFGPQGPWGEYLTVGGEETVCVVELEFLHGDDYFRVRRTYDSKGRGKTLLDFEAYREGDGNWRSETLGSQTETQALIENIIGLNEATFSHSVFAAQGARHFADPTLPPRERKEILSAALNLGVWDDLKKVCAADVATVKGEVEALEQRLGAYSDDLLQQAVIVGERESLAAQAKLAASDVALLEAIEFDTRGAHLAMKASAQQRETLEMRLGYTEQEVEAAKAVVVDADAAARKLVEVGKQIVALLPLAERAESLSAQVQALAVAAATSEQTLRERRTLLATAAAEGARDVEARTSARGILERANAIEAQIVAKQDDPGVCDHCGQTLAGEALAKAIASLRSDEAALRTEITRLIHLADEAATKEAELRAQGLAIEPPEPLDEETHRQLQHDTAKAQMAARDLPVLKATAATLEEKADVPRTVAFVERHAAAKREQAAAAAALEAVPPLDEEKLSALARELERANSDLTVARATDRQINAALAALDERLRHLAALAQRAQEATEEKTRLAARLDVLTALSRSYGRDGIPALILEVRAIPQLETEANRVLDQLDARMRFELVTQRENKGGGMKDTLDVLVHGERGTLRYESYSGGEQTRLAFALRVALARLVVGQHGAEVGILCLDEMTYLDATGVARMCEVLRGLTEFRSVVLVSHDERMTDAFDQIVTVVRDEAGSRLELAA